jgi:hypothetical protein
MPGTDRGSKQRVWIGMAVIGCAAVAILTWTSLTVRAPGWYTATAVVCGVVAALLFLSPWRLVRVAVPPSVLAFAAGFRSIAYAPHANTVVSVAQSVALILVPFALTYFAIRPALARQREAEQR